MSILMLALRTLRFVYALKDMLAGIEVDAETASKVSSVLSVLPETDVALLLHVVNLL